MAECYIRGNTIKYLRVPDEVIHKVQEETIKSRSDRRPPGVGRGSGRGREDGNSGSPAKGIGRGQDDGGPKGMGGGRGRGRCGGNKVEDKVVVQKLATERGANLPFLKALCSLSYVYRDRLLDLRAFTLVLECWKVVREGKLSA